LGSILTRTDPLAGGRVFAVEVLAVAMACPFTAVWQASGRCAIAPGQRRAERTCGHATAVRDGPENQYLTMSVALRGALQVVWL